MVRRFKVFLPGFLLWLAAFSLARAAPLVIGLEEDLHPLSFTDPNGKPSGFLVELIDAIAARSGFEVRYVLRPRPQLFADFEAKRVDVIGNAVRTPERDATMAFAVPHLDLLPTLFVRKDGPAIATPADLARVRIAVLPQTLGYQYLRSQGLTQQLLLCETLRDCLRAVADGRADATLGTRLFAVEILRRDRLANVAISPVEFPGLSYRFHIAVRPDDRLTLAAINEGLARLHDDGTYDQIYERWVGPIESRPLRLRDLQPYLPFTIAGLVLIGAAFFWQRRLLRQNARQARELRASEERLRRVLEGSQDGFWDWDMRANRIERSERWAGMLGFTVDEIPATLEAGAALVHRDDLPRYEAWQARLNTAGNERSDIEYRMRTKSGEWRWILDRGKVVARDAEGRPLRMAGTHTDITERKLTEAALLESQKLLRRSAQLLQQTQSAAQIGGWESDFRTGRVDWTPDTYRIYETTPDEYFPTRETVYDFYPPESRRRMTEAVAKATADGTAFVLELEIVTGKKNRRLVHLSALPEREGGVTVKLFGSVRDITAERQAEQDRENLRIKMLEAQKLESLGVLAGGIAHDFNNLLTVILANASFLRSDTDGEDERLAHIETAARRAADLCRQMLAYAGKGSFVIDHLDLGVLVRDTADLIRVSISKKARLELDLAPALPRVDGDVSQLRQVVMNLVINASEALGDHPGVIRVITRLGRPAAPASGVIHSFTGEDDGQEHVCLEISDTGQGMEAATLARIFDPFFTTKFAGRGLGLAAVLGIVRAHKGALTVESTRHVGSTFRLFLPIAPTAVAPVAPALTPRRANGTATGTVLIADDEPALLATADMLLRRRGYKTVLATDGHEAVKIFRADPKKFSAVLLDLTMPGLDGAEVLRILRSINPDVRALVMSGFSEQDVFDRLRGLGQATILRKPFTQDTLLERVAEVVAP